MKSELSLIALTTCIHVDKSEGPHSIEGQPHEDEIEHDRNGRSDFIGDESKASVDSKRGDEAGEAFGTEDLGWDGRG